MYKFILQHIQSALHIIAQYNSKKPLHEYLKAYFAENKKFGSMDRKAITDICYRYYRMGKLYQDQLPEKRLYCALQLTKNEDNETFTNAALSALNGVALNEGFTQLDYEQLTEFEMQSIFTYWAYLSFHVKDIHAFIQRHFYQPNVYIRIRPHKQSKVINQLNQHNIAYQLIHHDTLCFKPNIKLHEVLAIDEDVVIQDYASQQVAQAFSKMKFSTANINVWDACCGAAGKTILLHDYWQHINCSISDIRPSIIQTAKQRLKRAKIAIKQDLLLDLASQTYPFNTWFDLVLLDAPCSGSGTWSRTPEQLFFYEESDIQHLATKQYNILKHAAQQVKPQGYILYITCSVFAIENEKLVERFLLQHPAFSSVHSELLLGNQPFSDILYYHLLQKNA